MRLPVFILLSFLLLAACNPKIRYLKKKGMDKSCITEILDHAAMFFEVNSEYHLYMMHFDSTTKNGFMQEVYNKNMELLTYTYNHPGIQDCFRQLSREDVIRIYGEPTDKASDLRFFYHLALNPKAVNLSSKNPNSRFSNCSYFEFSFDENGMVEFFSANLYFLPDSSGNGEIF